MTYESGLSVEERVASLFQPDTVLPAQYLETVRRKTHLEPEKKLMLAVLEDGVACFQKYVLARDGKGQSLFHEAQEWILRDGSDWLFSFESICEALGLNPSYMSEGLLRWKEHRIEDLPKARIYQLAPPKRDKKQRVLSHRPDRKLRKAASR